MPEELVADKEMSRNRSVLFKLAPLERDIIARRFGFTYETETLEEIGQAMEPRARSPDSSARHVH